MDVRAEKVNITLYIKNFEGLEFSFKSDLDNAVLKLFMVNIELCWLRFST